MLNEIEVKELVDGVIDELICVDCRSDSPRVDYCRGGVKNLTVMLNKFYDIRLK